MSCLLFKKCDLCAYLMIGLKKCRHKDMLLKIQIPVSNCEEYTVWDLGFWTLLCE